MARLRLVLICLVIFALTTAASARSRRRHASNPAQAAQFDYYVLSLSWAPDFCAAPGGNKDSRECGPGRHIGFVVHGLWPQNNQAQGPENCSPASPVAASLVQLMLNYIPTQSLIQHEWRTHGTCSGLSTAEYFALVRKARDSVTIPSAFNTLTHTNVESAPQIETQFATANSGFPKTAFRATCASTRLQEIRVCFSKSLNPQACSESAGECTAPEMTILPPR